jgi:hypothetical protein
VLATGPDDAPAHDHFAVWVGADGLPDLSVGHLDLKVASAAALLTVWFLTTAVGAKGLHDHLQLLLACTSNRFPIVQRIRISLKNAAKSNGAVRGENSMM